MNRTTQTLLSVAALLAALGVLWAAVTLSGDVRFECNDVTGVYSTAHGVTIQPYDPACVDPDTGGPRP